MHSVDLFVQNYFSLTRTPGMTKFMYVVTTLFDVSFVFTLIVFCLLLIIFIKKGARQAILFVGALFIAAVSTYILKLLFHIVRPIGGAIVETGPSFPSYHATIATVFFGMLVYICAGHFVGWKKATFNILCVLGALTVGFSRLYLGVHWFSDVLGGIILGLFVSCVSVLVYQKSMLE